MPSIFRLTAFRKRLRADLMVKRLFFMWKYYIRIYSLKKQAFLSRLAALHRRRQLLLVWRPLHDHHKLLVNARYLMYCQQKRRITKAFDFWSRCLENRFAVQKKLTDVMTAIYFNQKRRLFMTWKVKVRHMERLFRSQVVKYTFKAWRKCYLSRVYYRLVLKNKMFLVWKEVIQVNRTVYSLYLLRRQKLANLLHRYVSFELDFPLERLI